MRIYQTTIYLDDLKKLSDEYRVNRYGSTTIKLAFEINGDDIIIGSRKHSKNFKLDLTKGVVGMGHKQWENNSRDLGNFGYFVLNIGAFDRDMIYTNEESSKYGISIALMDKPNRLGDTVSVKGRPNKHFGLRFDEYNAPYLGSGRSFSKNHRVNKDRVLTPEQTENARYQDAVNRGFVKQ